MEYKINNFNFADIPFKDIQSLTNYFETSVLQQEIKNLLIGPNVINLKYSNKTKTSVEENKKIINTICRLIFSNFLIKPEQGFILQSTSNLSSKSYMKKILKELDALITQKIQINNKQEIFNCIILYDFLSFFTCIKDEFFDEIPICDYLIQLYYEKDNGIKFANCEILQMNSEFISMRLYPFNQTQANSNNINIFYMMMFNLPLSDLKNYLYCDKTKDFFRIFDTSVDAEDFVKRYIFISSFQILKNSPQYTEIAKSKSNVEMIRKEFEYYKTCYKNYQTVKDYLRLGDDLEKHLFKAFCGILLLSEIDLVEDPLGNAITIKSTTSSNGVFSYIEIYTFLKSIIHADQRFSGKDKYHVNLSSERYDSILTKAAMNLDMSEEKIVFALVTELVQTNSLTLKVTKDAITNAKVQLISGIYYLVIDQIKLIFQNYKDITPTNANKFNFFIFRSNLVCNQIFTLSTPVDVNENSIKSKIFNYPEAFLVTNNVRESIISNYIQELKNFFVLSNALSITSIVKDFTWPVIQYNENFTSKLINDSYNFTSILQLYEHPSFGLLKLLDKEPRAKGKEDSILGVFKTNFFGLFQKDGMIELYDLNGSQTGDGRTYLQVKHTFGTFIYDLTECFVLKRASNTLSSLKEELLWKFLDYRPSMNERTHKENSYKLLKSLRSQMVYVNMLIKVNKFSIISMFEDLKLNNIYYFYRNFFSYIINMKDIRENILKNPKMTIASDLNIDDPTLFKIISKKIRISSLDFYYENGYIYAKNSFNRVMDYNKNISNFMFKYNHKMFYYLIVKKVSASDFSYFRFAIKAVRAYVKLTKIYNEKKIFRNVRNLFTDVVVDNYNIIGPNKDISSMNKEIVSKLEHLPELVFDFKKEALSKILPKLHSNLTQLTKMWKDYVTDIIYLEINKGNFSNPASTEMLIEERLINFQILMFLFSKKYNFVNFEYLRKFGVLLSKFTETISSEVLVMLNQLYLEFQAFLEEHDFKIEKREIVNFEKLITKRVSIVQEQQKRLNLEKAEQVTIFGEMKTQVAFDNDVKQTISPVIFSVEDNINNFSIITTKRASKKLEAVPGTKVDYIFEPTMKNNQNISFKEVIVKSENAEERNQNKSDESKMVYSKVRNANNRKIEKFINNRYDNKLPLDIQIIAIPQKENALKKEKETHIPQDEKSNSNFNITFKPIRTEEEILMNKNTRNTNENNSSTTEDNKRNPQEEKITATLLVNDNQLPNKQSSPTYQREALIHTKLKSNPLIISNSEISSNLDNTPKFGQEKPDYHNLDKRKFTHDRPILQDDLLVPSIHSSSESEKLMDKKRTIEQVSLSPDQIDSINHYFSGNKEQLTYLEHHTNENGEDTEDNAFPCGFFSCRNINMKKVHSFKINGKQLRQQIENEHKEQRMSKSHPKVSNVHENVYIDSNYSKLKVGDEFGKGDIKKKDMDQDKDNDQFQVYQKKKVGIANKPQSKRLLEKEDGIIQETKSRREIHQNLEEDPTQVQDALLLSPKKYYSEKSKGQVQLIKLTALKELDDQIEILKKELMTLEIMEALTQQTSLLCFGNDTPNDDIDISTFTKKVNEKFYVEIDASLKAVETIITANSNGVI